MAMSDNGDKDNGIELLWKPAGRNGQATVTARLNGEILACESFNLTKPKQRADFTSRLCADRPGIHKGAVEAELVRLAADLANKPKEKDTADESTPDRLATMPESIRAEARAMLEGPGLLKRVVDDIGTLGVAGEKELAATVYLIGTSRLLSRPLAAIVQGPTSSGKSYVIDKVATLFPPEAVVFATQMTPQALFHMKPSSLKHRFIVAGERSRKEDNDTAEATRALREMLGSGRLVKLMPVKMGNEIETVEINQEGPVAYVESTTLSRIFDEDANRAVLLTTDEQQEQTRRILDKLAEGYQGATPEGAIDHVVTRHHALQRTLQGQAVVVPFAKRLGDLLAADRVEARRAFPHLISMVQASALLHQRQRQIDGDGRLLAETDDYQLARHLLLKPLGRLLGGRLSDPVRRFYERLQGWYPAEEAFTVRQAARNETASKSAVYGWVASLHDAGLLEQVEDQRGTRAAKYRLSAEGMETESNALLPPLENVFPETGWKHGHKP
jgi:hypothetical protein